jgi:hypothetical protein
MPRKKFEETPYNPISADLAREVATGVKLQPISSVIPLRQEEPIHSAKIVSMQPQQQPLIAPVVCKRSEATITKRFVVSREEDTEMTEFLLRLQKKAGTKVSLSVFTRALLNIAMQAEEQIAVEIGEGFSKALPSTHDSMAYADFEDRWMRCLGSALRKMPRVKA